MKPACTMGLSFALLVFLMGHATACPVCYGANDSPMNAGMDTAIVVMLGITGSVLGIFIVFFLWIWRRTRRERERISEGAFVDESGQLQLSSDKGIMEWNNT